MSRCWLVLRLEAPLMSFGGVAVDHVGPVRDFPAASMLTGLIGNALGWKWSDRRAHQGIQDRLVFAARRDREGVVLTDTQNAQLAGSDKAWTTRGEPEGRGGASFGGPHRRQRSYLADSSVCIVICLDPADKYPSLEVLADAFDKPARTLFLGRKPCLPSAPVLGNKVGRWVMADTAHAALSEVPGDGKPVRSQWPIEHGPEAGGHVDHVTDLADLRNWRTGIHGGSRRVVEGWVIPATAK